MASSTFKYYFKFYQGAIAALVSSLAFFALQAEAFAMTAAVNKPIDTGKMHSVLEIKTYSELIRVIQNEVAIYRIEYPRTTMDPASTEINSVIAALAKTPNDIVNLIGHSVLNTLYGVFLPFEEHARVLKKDVILFRDDATAWTIVHEYFHFLFNQSRRLLGIADHPHFKTLLSDSFETHAEMTAAFRHNNQSFATTAQQSEYILSLQTILKHKLPNILNFSFEEVLIEQHLQKYYQTQLQKQQQSLLTAQDYEYSARYIEKNLDKVYRETGQMLRLITEAEALLPVDVYQKLKPELDKYRSQYQQILEAMPALPTKKRPAQQTVFS